MTDSEDPIVAASETFDVLGEVARVELLATLVDEYSPANDDPMGFSDLRRAAGFDDAGRFNYHLDKLTPEFVEKRDGGYAPTRAGRSAMDAAEIARYTDDPPTRLGPTSDRCPHCENHMTATYENHRVVVECDDHGVMFETPTEGEPKTDAGIDDIVEAGIRGVLRRVDRTVAGHCPVCGASLPPVEFDANGDGVRAHSRCDRCYFRETNAPGLFVLADTAVIAFYHDHGIDVRTTVPASYASDWLGDGDYIAGDPGEVAFTVTAGGDELDVRLTADRTVHVE